ncbi:MAG: AI-2E family transporter [Alphaproteobacteria bacterium]|nr:AI-2E family transporter [Alphaproteobacteria bacterium]
MSTPLPQPDALPLPGWRSFLGAFWFAIAVLIASILIVGKDLLIPLALAVMVWLTINALAKAFARLRLGTWRAPHWLCLILALATIGFAVFATGRLIGDSIASITKTIPAYEDNLRRLVAGIDAKFGTDVKESAQNLLRQVSVSEIVRRVGNTFTSLAADIGVVIIYVIFLLIEQQSFERKLKALFPEGERKAMAEALLTRIADDVETYIGLMTVLCAAMALISYGVMVAVGLDYAAFWAFMIFLLNFVPTIGPIVALVGPALLALVQFDTLTPFIVVTAGIGLTQFFIANVVQPRVTSTSLNISAFVVIMSLFVWNAIWGITGMFLCVPIMASLMIVLANFPQTRAIAIMLSSDGNVRTLRRANGNGG